LPDLQVSFASSTQIIIYKFVSNSCR